MAQPYVPDPAALSTLDEEFQFFALIGVLANLHAALDEVQFDLFDKASGWPHEMARDVYFSNQNDSARRLMTDLALKHVLKQGEYGRWGAIKGRIPPVSDIRNLFSHNSVRVDVTVNLTGIEAIMNPPPLPLPQPAAVVNKPIRRFYAKLDHDRAKAMSRKAIEGDVADLKRAVEELTLLHVDLEKLLQSIGKSSR